jgi:hypothetical protein
MQGRSTSPDNANGLQDACMSAQIQVKNWLVFHKNYCSLKLFNRYWTCKMVEIMLVDFVEGQRFQAWLLIFPFFTPASRPKYRYILSYALQDMN